MRHSWHLEYGFDFKAGKKLLYIYKYYRIGIVKMLQERMELRPEQAQTLAELIIDEVSKEKPE